MVESVINAPVWIQTPLVLFVMLAVCIPIAVGLRLLVFRIVPLTAEERRLLGYADAVDGATGGLATEEDAEEEKERVRKP
ncbi:MAG TPA: hypothetical protein H9867_07300 [Candidatus Corynebacterium gallistercoris]|uniref:Uncharacterized protein n=1 Tax=Candidatus Corynebacterium gallistercoris TaxID=2838530 RepID=A0A9D1RYU6_9CORY|nr:hypothetical protein [Candidatus Corynebacterium gallistercoris]